MVKTRKNWGWAKRARLAKRRAQLAILAAALGFASCGVWDVGAVATASAFADETSKARPVGVVANEKPARGTAFIVGADDYAEASDLQCVRNDVDALTERLVEIGFERENITTLKTGGDFDRFPTKENIEKYFASFVETLREGDFVVVYLSGHGIQPESSKETFFAPIDVKANDPFATSVSIDAMLKKLENSKARFRWVIVDACRNDPTAPNKGIFNVKMSGVRNLTDFADAPDSVAVFRSCGPGECSYEGEKNGVFTQSLLEALDKKNAKADGDGDGALMFTEVLQYVTKRTKELAYKNHRGASQRPTLDGSASDFVLLDDFGGGGTFWAALILSTLACGAAGVAVLFRWKAAATFAPVSTPVVVPSATDVSSWEPDAEDASRKTWEDADKLASEAWTAFDLGGVANVEKAIRLMKESLALVELAANRRALKTFEGELEALRKARAEEERKKREADKLAADALAAFDLGGVANVAKAIKLMKESLALVELAANRRALKTFEEALAALKTKNGWSAEYTAGTRQTLQIKGVEYAFRYCPPGTFLMGSPESEKWRSNAETQHEVTLTNGFWLLETPVTQAMWKSVMGSYSNPSWFSSSGGGKRKVRGMDTSNFPVDSVSWNDCQKFVKNLNSAGLALDGFKFRLPTEAEWEYACRAGTPGPYAGSSLDSLGWYFGNSGLCTHEVGTKSANRWGLYDMHGNVCEWCEDLYADYNNLKSVQNPINVTTGSYRVLRGGSWIGDARHCRSAYRNYGGPTDRGRYCGFRLALGREL